MNTPQDKRQILLFVTHINFWEKDLGSRMRLFKMLNYLKVFFSIKIVYIAKRQKDDFDKLEKIDYHKQVIFLDELNESEVDENKIDTFLNIHTVLKDFYDKSLYRKMQTFINNNFFDSVIIEYIHLSYFLPLLGDKKCLLDSYDVMNIRNNLFKKNNQDHWIDISEKEEFALFLLYDQILAIQKKEHIYLSQNGIPSLLVPYSLSVSKKKLENKIENLVFVGAQTSANTEAINWFISKVWPLFSCSGLQLIICGDVSKNIQTNKEILGAKNIILKGRVDDLNSFYLNNTDLIINPVHIGGGLKIKNAEALAYGLPLITTTEGANGLEDGSNFAFLLANSIEDWQDAIITMMLSGTLREKLSINAYKFAKNYFDEKNCYDELIQVLLQKSGDETNANIAESKTGIVSQYNRDITPLISKEMNAFLGENIPEVKKQMNQYQKHILTHEILSYSKALDALATTSITRHPIRKIIKYRYLIKIYNESKYFIYCHSLSENDQILVHQFREKLEKLHITNIKHNPKKKIEAYRELVEWYSNLEFKPFKQSETLLPFFKTI